MFLHEKLELRLFQAGLKLSKLKFDRDEVRTTLENFAATAPPTRFVSREDISPTSTLSTGSDTMTKEQMQKLQNVTLAENMIGALDRFQEDVGRGLGFGT